MNRVLLTLLLLFVTNQTHAGFITGVLVGSAINSDGGSSTQGSKSLIISSEKHDAISCRKSAYGNMCELRVPVKGAHDCYEGQKSSAFFCFTPSEFAAHSGYSRLFKRGVVFNDGHEYIIMEVGN